jgi:uncharacterized protein (UPF0332 family)
MSFRGSQFIALAQSLASKTTPIELQEASLRSAISRAYYGSFWEARDKAESEGFTRTGSGKDHILVREHFARGRNKQRKKLSHDLRRLHNNRKQADYEILSSGEVQKLSAASITLAQSIVSHLSMT